MTSETRTTLTFLGAGLVAAAMALGADMSWADVIKALFGPPPPILAISA